MSGSVAQITGLSTQVMHISAMWLTLNEATDTSMMCITNTRIYFSPHGFVSLRKRLNLFRYSVYHRCHLSVALLLTSDELSLFLT